MVSLLLAARPCFGKGWGNEQCCGAWDSARWRGVFIWLWDSKRFGAGGGLDSHGSRLYGIVIPSAGFENMESREKGEMSEGIQASIRRFWLEECTAKMRFQKDPTFDREIERRFGPCVERALAGELDSWSSTPESALSLILVLDQFTRNIYRETPKMIAGDIQALRMTLTGVERGDLETFTELEAVLPDAHDARGGPGGSGGRYPLVRGPLWLSSGRLCHPPSGYCSALWTVSAPQCHFGACIHLGRTGISPITGVRVLNEFATEGPFSQSVKNQQEPETVKPGILHPFVVWVFRWLLGPLLRLAFRPTLRGLEKLPRGKPYLLVANHSAGVAIAEILCFAMLYAGHFKNRVPLAGYAHHVVMKVWPFSWIMPALGAIPSTYEAAEKTLAAEFLSWCFRWRPRVSAADLESQ